MPPQCCCGGTLLFLRQIFAMHKGECEAKPDKAERIRKLWIEDRSYPDEDLVCCWVATEMVIDWLHLMNLLSPRSCQLHESTQEHGHTLRHLAGPDQSNIPSWLSLRDLSFCGHYLLVKSCLWRSFSKFIHHISWSLDSLQWQIDVPGLHSWQSVPFWQENSPLKRLRVTIRQHSNPDSGIISRKRITPVSVSASPYPL